MLEKNEQLIAKAIKEYRVIPKKYLNKEILEDVISGITSILKIKPNFERNNPLTFLEIFCLIFMVSGKNTDTCAKLLNSSQHSIRTYEKRFRKKLGAKNRAHAFYLALLEGYIIVVM